MKIDVRDFNFNENEEERFFKGKRKVKTKIHDDYQRKDNRKFNKHKHIIKKGYDEE